MSTVPSIEAGTTDSQTLGILPACFPGDLSILREIGKASNIRRIGAGVVKINPHSFSHEGKRFLQ
jgi:hypothetical protein